MESGSISMLGNVYAHSFIEKNVCIMQSFEAQPYGRFLLHVLLHQCIGVWLMHMSYIVDTSGRSHLGPRFVYGCLCA